MEQKREEKDKGGGVVKEYVDIDGIELDAFLAILIASGVTHQERTAFKHLWNDSSFVPSIFSVYMSR